MVLVPVENSGEEQENDEVEVFAFRYEELGDSEEEVSFYPIETDEEWDIVEEMLNTFTEEN